MMEPLISVIVPIFNVENYLSKCIESIINQHYQNMEIILVDDGSTDLCPIICDEYATKDFRIKVIHKKNGGLSDARNVGMDLATGKYISFVDSDDWIEADMLQTLFKLIHNYGADIAECGFHFTGKENSHEDMNKEDSNILNTEKIITLDNIKASECFLDRSINIEGAVTNKIYDNNNISKLRFPVGKLHEDAFFTYKALYYSTKYVRTESKKYNYNQGRPGSIMSVNVKPINILTVIEAFEERNNFYNDNNEKVLYLKSKAYYYATLLSEYKNVTLNLKREKELKKLLKKKLLSNFKDIIANPYTNKYKFYLFIIISIFN